MADEPAPVLLVGHYAPDRQHSMLLYGDLVARLLAERGHAVARIRPEPVVGRWCRGRLAKWGGHVDKWVLFPRRLRREAGAFAGVVHLPDHSHGPYVPLVRDRAHVVTVHDLMAIRSALGEIPGQATRWSGRRLQGRILAGLRQARAAICPSEHARRDLARLAPVPAARCRVIPHGLNAGFRRVGRDEAVARLAARLPSAGEGRFLLHVGSDSWYKDRDAVVAAFAGAARSRPDLRLVLAGPAPSAAQRRVLDAAGLGSRVAWVEGASHAELEALYGLAAALVFPSIEEGFGWPPLEAQACGCPVVATTGGALAEVLAGGALVSAPGDRDALLANVVRVLDDPAVAAARVEAGVANLARFRLATMGDALSAWITGLAEGPA